MVTLLDVLHKIGFAPWNKAEYNQLSNIELLQNHIYSIRFIITTNLEAAEERYYNKYGHGETYYFPLVDYEQGKTLAKQLYQYLKLELPDRYSDPEILSVGKKMFLFIFTQEATGHQSAELMP